LSADDQAVTPAFLPVAPASLPAGGPQGRRRKVSRPTLSRPHTAALRAARHGGRGYGYGWATSRPAFPL